MSGPFASVDVAALIKVVWVSVIAGAGVTLAYSGALYGTSRAAEARRGGRSRERAVFVGLAAVCSVVVGAALIGGFLLMTSK